MRSCPKKSKSKKKWKRTIFHLGRRGWEVQRERSEGWGESEDGWERVWTRNERRAVIERGTTVPPCVPCDTWTGPLLFVILLSSNFLKLYLSLKRNSVSFCCEVYRNVLIKSLEVSCWLFVKFSFVIRRGYFMNKW